MIRAQSLLVSFIVLSLAACAPSDEGKEDGARPPVGFELAMARTAGEAASASVIDLTPDELEARIAAGNIRLIDVRTAEEVAQGMIEGAEHIALDSFDPAKLDFSDGREVVLYCRSGRRSRIAGEALAEHTGAPAPHLGGGIIAWEAAGKPVFQPQLQP